MNAWIFFKCVDCKDLSVNLRTTHRNPGQQCKAVEVFSVEKKISISLHKSDDDSNKLNISFFLFSIIDIFSENILNLAIF